MSGGESPPCEAAIFDLDGVITDTASVHAQAWKVLFDEFLAQRPAADESREPFDPVADYLAYVDGKPRADGVRDFLRARGIELPEGEPDDGPDCETIVGLGRCKDGYFKAALKRDGVKVFAGGVRLIEELRAAGTPTAVVSSSRNCANVLHSAGLEHLFDVRVDGRTSAELGFAGKPAPDMFLEGARRLDAAPLRSMVVEDAISGVEAGRAGGFGLVVGVARRNAAATLRAHGADLAVTDLEELNVDTIRRWFSARTAGTAVRA